MLLASTKRQVGVSRSNEINVFFKNSQMYGVKTLLVRFEHSFISFFSKEQFYRFFKDVHNKTLTFEVPNPPKMEAENYKKNVIIQKIRNYFDFRYKIKQISKISRFGIRFGSQNGAKLPPRCLQEPSKKVPGTVLRAKMDPRHSQDAFTTRLRLSQTPPRRPRCL